MPPVLHESVSRVKMAVARLAILAHDVVLKPTRPIKILKRSSNDKLC